MNCKQGDMFIVIKGVDAGKIGICEYLASEEEVVLEAKMASGVEEIVIKENNIWRISFQKAWGVGFVEYEIPYVPDNQIHPLRDTDEEDEMLSIAGKPKEKENVE